VWHTATTESGETTTAAALMTTVNQQTSTTDRDSSTVTADVTTVTDSQTLAGTYLDACKVEMTIQATEKSTHGSITTCVSE